MTGTEWFEDAVIYQVFIDRFAGLETREGWSKPRFMGGDLEGITERLDYIEDLGVDVLWISPFYETSAYHGYHVTDYFSVDPQFGDEEDLEKLISEVHERDMKIIADFVPNHCSWKHPYFVKAQENRESRYREWFYFNDWPWHYTTFLHFPELPKLNLSNPETRNHLLEAANYWLEKGLDGYRIDHATGLQPEFLEEFSSSVKSEFPEAVLIGEAWFRGVEWKDLETLRTRRKHLKWLMPDSQEREQKSYVDLLDGVLDFKFHQLIHKYLLDDSITHPGAILQSKLEKHYSRYPDDFYLPNFLDNHDMDRALFQCGNNREKLKEAARVQLSSDQPSIIYYGTEAGMTHERSIHEPPEHGDLLARKPMNWDDRDEELYQFYRNLIREK